MHIGWTEEISKKWNGQKLTDIWEIVVYLTDCQTMKRSIASFI